MFDQGIKKLLEKFPRLKYLLPVRPEKGFLNRSKMVAAARPITRYASPMLREMIDYGTVVLRQIGNVAPRGDEALAIDVPYLHLLEMLDAFEVQIRQAVVEPAMTSLRSALEAYLTIAYVLEDDTSYMNRALSYVHAEIRGRIKLYTELDQTSPQGKDLLKAISTDRLASKMKIPNIADPKKRILLLEGMYKKPPFDALEAEFQNTRKRLKVSNPKWYSLYRGPTSLELLAKHLNLWGTYKILYPSWSKITHGTTISRKLIKSPDGTPALIGLRNISELRTMVQIGGSLWFECTRMLIQKFMPGEGKDFALWYMMRVRSRFRKL